MSRSQRLFDLLQYLRRHRYPISARQIAQEFTISVRSVYRDIDSLKSLGADIQGEAGVGYLLKDTFNLPPLMFTPQELDVLLLGANWAAKQNGGEFSADAKNAIAKISAVLPDSAKKLQYQDVVRVPVLTKASDLCVSLDKVKRTISSQIKVNVEYRDVRDTTTTRIIWPLLLGIFENCFVLVSWCESRSDFRHFRLDRIQSWTESEQRYERSRSLLIREWEQKENISSSVIQY
ncbi:helix-turn-helix transcriptional regulator [Vibrio viridaestus]|uniref:YafY family transcriptional regulator n=1 Tax=Vibrio viridaestus TaxID=2487322 RepID=A0A3N9TK06_9VIBR|nr:YafY family protein [Vibrio viridaestus]RQW64718.1 YafY family transcriptional regulator [Vibrio viridaestus]